MLKLSIHRLNLPLHDSNAVNLETIELGVKHLKNYGFHGGPQFISDVSCRPMNT